MTLSESVRVRCKTPSKKSENPPFPAISYPALAELWMCQIYGKKAQRYFKKLNFQAVIKLAASAASLDLQGSPPAVRMPSRRPWAPLQIQGGCASSQLDHSLKVQLFQNLPKTFPKLLPIAANPFPQYLAPLAAKYMEKTAKKIVKNCLFDGGRAVAGQAPLSLEVVGLQISGSFLPCSCCRKYAIV